MAIIFLRDVRSVSYFEQMKVVRTIPGTDLKSVLCISGSDLAAPSRSGPLVRHLPERRQAFR